MQAVRSAVVPPLCVACDEPELSGRPLCAECRRQLRPVGDPRCPRCGAPGTVCRECRGRDLAFDRAWSGFQYEGVARDLVHAVKARGVTYAALGMAEAMVDRVPGDLLDFALVPVPAHPARTRRHGYNHAWELAWSLTYVRGGTVLDVLKRRDSRPQVGKQRAERIADARDSVTVAKDPRLDSVTLIDDVYTTGATLDACARALRQAGVRQITAVTFARAVKD